MNRRQPLKFERWPRWRFWAPVFVADRRHCRVVRCCLLHAFSECNSFWVLQNFLLFRDVGVKNNSTFLCLDKLNSRTQHSTLKHWRRHVRRGGVALPVQGLHTFLLGAVLFLIYCGNPVFLFSLCFLITTTQPLYLHNLISTQRPRSTRSSSVVTLARPPSSSSLKTTDRSFRYASPCLWNQLPLSFRKPHSGTSSSISYSPIPSPITSSFSDSPLCTSITLSLFQSRLKTYLFHKSYPRSFTSSSRTASTNFCVHRFFWATWFLILSFPYFSFLRRALD